MTKKAATFFDDIIKALEIRGESAKFANLSKKTATDFFSDTLNKPVAAPAVEASQQQRAASGMTFPSVPPSMPQASREEKPVPVAPVQQNPITPQQAQNQAQPAQAGQVIPGQPSAPAPSAPEQLAQVSDPGDISQLDLPTLRGICNQCTKCELYKGRKNVVFGAGNPQADLMFIGEGPGRDEDIQGIPFVGEAGQLLTKMINAMQFTRSDVYIANIVKCRPPNNRNPEDVEAETCLPFLRRQIQLINPKVIVILGAVPLKYLLNKTGITKRRGVWDSYEGIQVMPTFHPAYLLRNASAKKQVWEDLQKVMRVFGRSYHPVQKR